MVDGTLRFDTKLDDSGFKAGANKLSTFAKSTGSAVASIGAAAGKTALAATAAAATGIIAITKQAVSAAADFEQLTESMDILFGAASDSIKAKAQEAYKSVGMSANQYMDTAASISSFITRDLGKTQEAVDAVDRAMTDIADNVATFGTDQQSIVQAYQSLARGQYQMLDNLKLGYGGTKEELSRLIADANTWAQANGRAADLSVDKFSDVVTAIGYIQEKLGIAGKAASEAEGTLSGSFLSLKASWENLLTALGDPSADVSQATTQLTDSFNNVVKNISPMIKSALTGISQVLPEVGKVLLDLIPPVTQDLLPALGTAIKNVFTFLAAIIPTAVTGLAKILPSIIQSVLTALADIAISIADALPGVLTGLIQVLQSFIKNDLPRLVTGILNALEKLADSGIFDQLVEVVRVLLDSIIQIISQNKEQVLGIVEKLLTAMIGALAALLGVVAEFVLKFLVMLVTEIANPKYQVQINQMVLTILWEIVKALGRVHLQFMLMIGNAIVSLFVPDSKKIAQNGQSASNSFCSSALQVIYSKLISFWNSGAQVIQNISNGIIAGSVNIYNSVTNICANIVNGFSYAINRMRQVGQNIMSGLYNGLVAGWGRVQSIVTNISNSITGIMRKLHLIHSPSKAFEKIGEYDMMGLAQGFEKYKKNPLNKVKEVSKSVLSGLAESFNPDFNLAYAAPNASNIYDNNFKIATPQQSKEISQVFNFYDTQTSPEAIRRKVENIRTFGLAGSF